jgi:hypothetical protein
MAVPVYTTDLVTIAYADDDAPDAGGGTWTEMVGHTGGGADTPDTDYFIFGAGCITQAVAGKTGTQAGLQYNYGSDIGGSFKTGTCVFMWHVMLAGNAMDSFANGGMRMYIGDAAGDWYGWKTGGYNFARNPYGGWHNVVVDPTFTGDYQEGTPTLGAYQYFCSLPNMVNAVSKGNVHGVDAIRYGRGSFIVSGGEHTAGYSTFAGMAAANDDQNARWGLFQAQAGGYLWKGQMDIGVRSLPNSAFFVDSYRSITVDDTPRTYRKFNQIRVINPNTKLNWTGINVSSLSPTGGLLSPGQFEVVDDAEVRKDTCVFTDLDRFVYKHNGIIQDSTYRRCENIRQGTTAFTRCVFEDSRGSAAVSASDLEQISYCDFTRDLNRGGRSHAIAISASGSYNFTGNTFSDYGPTATPSAAILNNSGGLVTINVLDGGDSPTYENRGSSTTNVIVSVSYTLTGLVSGSEVQIVTQTNETPLYHLEIATEEDGITAGKKKAVYSYNYTTDTPIYAYIHHVDYRWLRVTDVLTNESKSQGVAQQFDQWYSNP